MPKTRALENFYRADEPNSLFSSSTDLEEFEEDQKTKASPPTYPGVLICDDEPMLKELIATSLEEKGFEVFQAKDGQEGIEVFQDYHANIQLIITDLTMPRVSGGEFIKAAQELDPSVKSIIMTGFSKSELPAELNHRHIEVINKPFSMSDLIKLALQVTAA